MSLPKNRREISGESPGTINGLVRHHLDISNESMEAIAERAGMTRSRVYELREGRTFLRTHETARFCRAVRDVEIVDRIEADLGRVGVLLPVVGQTRSLASTGSAIKEFGELIHKVGKHASRGYTAAEAAHIRREGIESIAEIHALIRQIDAEASTGGMS